MNAETAIAPLGAVLGPVAGAPTALPVEGPSLDALSQRFEAMMKDAPADAASTQQPSVIGKMLDQQQSSMAQEQELTDFMRQNASSMPDVERTMRTIELTELSASNSFKLHAISSVSSNVNKSIQQLLKNS